MAVEAQAGAVPVEVTVRVVARARVGLAATDRAMRAVLAARMMEAMVVAVSRVLMVLYSCKSS